MNKKFLKAGAAAAALGAGVYALNSMKKEEKRSSETGQSFPQYGTR